MPTPYAQYVDGRDPVDVLTETLTRYRVVFANTPQEKWQTPWAPGKWTRHQVLIHVAQWELIFSTRVRMALAIPEYVVQPMDQDPLLDIEAPFVDVATASAAFDAVRSMNIALIRGLSPETRATVVTHPERGRIDVNDLIVTLAGHAVHHLNQIED
ncbi:MAG: DinB family protein [Acidimicrobiia bacterium]|nr:DinB family protein [Acidimicrobiia bacterium]